MQGMCRKAELGNSVIASSGIPEPELEPGWQTNCVRGETLANEGERRGT